METRKIIDIIKSLDYIELCNCDACIEIKPLYHRSFSYMKFKESNISITLNYCGDDYPNSKYYIKYYINGCPFSNESKSYSFEEIFDLLPEYILSRVIFDINLFK